MKNRFTIYIYYNISTQNFCSYILSLFSQIFILHYNRFKNIRGVDMLYFFNWWEGQSMSFQKLEKISADYTLQYRKILSKINILPENIRFITFKSYQNHTGIILYMCPAIERWHYSVTLSFIGRAHIQNGPWAQSYESDWHTWQTCISVLEHQWFI